MSYTKRVDLNATYGQDVQGELVTGADAVFRSIQNILSCPIGSRGYNPSYGSNLPHLLWQPYGPQTAVAIEMSVAQALERNEPDLKLEPGGVIVTSNSDGKGTYALQLVGTLIGTNEIFNQTLILGR